MKSDINRIRAIVSHLPDLSGERGEITSSLQKEIKNGLLELADKCQALSELYSTASYDMTMLSEDPPPDRKWSFTIFGHPNDPDEKDFLVGFGESDDCCEDFWFALDKRFSSIEEAKSEIEDLMSVLRHEDIGIEVNEYVRADDDE
jgi:hypothetical protein